jgi:hypothetical protein
MIPLIVSDIIVTSVPSKGLESDAVTVAAVELVIVTEWYTGTVYVTSISAP